MKKIEPVIKEDGKTILVMDADEANSDWIRARRLSKKELKRKLKSPMYTRS